MLDELERCFQSTLHLVNRRYTCRIGMENTSKPAHLEGTRNERMKGLPALYLWPPGRRPTPTRTLHSTAGPPMKRISQRRGARSPCVQSSRQRHILQEVRVPRFRLVRSSALRKRRSAGRHRKRNTDIRRAVSGREDNTCEDDRQSRRPVIRTYLWASRGLHCPTRLSFIHNGAIAIDSVHGA